LPLLEQVLERNPTDVKLVFKNFPLSSHKFAQSAAQAALAAHAQNKFWPFHDKLFENYSALNDEKIEAIAKELSLDLERFKQDWRARSVNQAVLEDLREGVKWNVRGTPTIFVNGRLLQNRSPEGFQAVIDGEVAKAKAGGAAGQ